MSFFILFCQFFISTIELFAVLITALTLFRFPLRYNIVKITIIASVTSIISIYNFQYFPNFALVANITTEAILIMFIFALPFFYALLITVIGMLLGGTIEYATILLGSNFSIFTNESVITNISHRSIAYLSTAIILFMIAYFLHKTKIGFMFITNRMTVRYVLKKYNIIIAAVILVSIISFQLVSVSYNKFSVHTFGLLIMLILFCGGSILAYKQNKKLLNEKYERLKNRK